MNVDAALGAAAALLSLAFALLTYERWLSRRAPHTAAWTVALWLFTLAATSFWWGAAHGWSPAAFRVFYTFGAVLNVPVLALGSAYLALPRATADRLALATGALVCFGAGVVIAAPMHGTVPVHELPRGSEVFGAGPRVAAAVASSVGAVAIAAFSARSLLRARQLPHPSRVVMANVGVLAGTAALSAGGLLNSVADEMTGFAISLVTGVALLCLGFLAGSPPPSRPLPDRVDRRLDRWLGPMDASPQPGR